MVQIAERPRWRVLSRALDNLNGPIHRTALLMFVAIVSTHWLEHLVQAVQVWVFDVPRKQALGALGNVWPWLVRSESLHAFYAVATMIPLLVLARAFAGDSRRWWYAAAALQGWHLVEHALLLYQAATGARFFGGAVPMSVLQAVVPRIELHLFYNMAVTIPMTVAMILHSRDRAPSRCGCGSRTRAVTPSVA